jgi:hypothetical protein
MNLNNKTDRKILFFDTFIIDSNTVDGHSLLLQKLDNIRTKSYSYRWQWKLDIVKYTLSSYSVINWDKVIIRFECENPNDTEIFYNFAKSTFPDALIFNNRSDSVQKYLDALNNLECNGDPWIFFSPNNDHPYIANPNDIDNVLNDAEDVEVFFPDHYITVAFSHYTEGSISASSHYFLWGYYAFNLSKIIGETENSYIVKNTRFMSDSNKLFRLSTLKKLFKASNKNGRVIRLEKLESYLSPDIKEIAIHPKKELCRHYDGYLHMNLFKIPVLFIPDGFFKNEIKIRYGYQDTLKGYVNINPLGRYSFSNNGNTDLKCLLNQIPFFWKDKIKSIDINPAINNILTRNKMRAFDYYVDLTDPYRKIPKIFIYVKSLFTYTKISTREQLRLLILRSSKLTYFYKLIKDRN